MILAEYRRGDMHSWPLEAARDRRLNTAVLFALAAKDIETSRSGSPEETGSRALLVLQQRTDDETAAFLERALGESPTPSEREAAARVMKEFPSVAAAPTTYSIRFLRALDAAALVENDDDTLATILRAIGWQCLVEAQPILLRHRNDPREGIRDAVSNCLLMARDPSESSRPLDERVATALLDLARDRSTWIAGGVLYDVAEHPALFARHAESFRRVAREALNSDDDQLRRWAAAALKSLEPFP
jgi:hypothetical protein